MFTAQDRILVAVSGGKDSLALWDILQRIDYHADGLYIGLGIDHQVSYAAESQRCCEEFAAQRGLDLIVYDSVEPEGPSLPLAAQLTHRGREKPCSVRGLAKRHAMNHVAQSHGNTVLQQVRISMTRLQSCSIISCNGRLAFCDARDPCWMPAPILRAK
jgi:tRNA(Ile)-lysidine synthase TilS/MesJ